MSLFSWATSAVIPPKHAYAAGRGSYYRSSMSCAYIARPAGAGQGHCYGDRPMMHSYLETCAIPDVEAMSEIGIKASLPGLCLSCGEFEGVKLEHAD